MAEGFQRKSVISGLRAAAKPITKAVRQAAPKDQGHLRKSIGLGVPRKFSYKRLGVKDGEFAVIVGSVKKHVRGEGREWLINLAAMKELGHKTRNRNSRVPGLFFQKSGMAAYESGIASRYFQGLQKYINKIGA